MVSTPATHAVRSASIILPKDGNRSVGFILKAGIQGR
jgi:hypothetical protein